MTLTLTIFLRLEFQAVQGWTFYGMEPVLPFHLIISDYNQSKPPDCLFSMIDYEKSNNRTTLVQAIHKGHQQMTKVAANKERVKTLDLDLHYFISIGKVHQNSRI